MDCQMPLVVIDMLSGLLWVMEDVERHGFFHPGKFLKILEFFLYFLENSWKKKQNQNLFLKDNLIV